LIALQVLKIVKLHWKEGLLFLLLFYVLFVINLYVILLELLCLFWRLTVS